jgi:hypothetical protein
VDGTPDITLAELQELLEDEGLIPTCIDDHA